MCVVFVIVCVSYLWCVICVGLGIVCVICVGFGIVCVICVGFGTVCYGMRGVCM